MTILRSFTARDIPVLKKEMYPSLSSEQIGAFICEWEKKKYKDRYFEMFAVICGVKRRKGQRLPPRRRARQGG